MDRGGSRRESSARSTHSARSHLHPFVSPDAVGLTLLGEADVFMSQSHVYMCDLSDGGIRSQEEAGGVSRLYRLT